MKCLDLWCPKNCRSNSFILSCLFVPLNQGFLISKERQTQIFVVVLHFLSFTFISLEPLFGFWLSSIDKSIGLKERQMSVPRSLFWKLEFSFLVMSLQRESQGLPVKSVMHFYSLLDLKSNLHRNQCEADMHSSSSLDLLLMAFSAKIFFSWVLQSSCSFCTRDSASNSPEVIESQTSTKSYIRMQIKSMVVTAQDLMTSSLSFFSLREKQRVDNVGTRLCQHRSSFCQRTGEASWTRKNGINITMWSSSWDTPNNISFGFDVPVDDFKNWT